MAQHPNEKLLTDVYNAFAKGDPMFMFGHCLPEMTWTVPGSTPFSGVHSNEGFMAALGQVMQISAGTFGESPVRIVANDDSGVVVLDHWLERDGKRIDYRTDHLWGIKDGKFISWEERPGNLEEFNTAWS